MAEQYLEERDGRKVITAAGKKRLSSLVTDVNGPVYAVTGALSPVITAAAMARLSRRGDDLRVTLLDEFLGPDSARKRELAIEQLDSQLRSNDEALLRRVITQYGDDSVQQLNGVWAVIEGCSNLMTKLVERPRLAAYLEQSTRYIFYDTTDEQGRYRYHVPTNLPKALADHYRAEMDVIFETYSRIVRRLTEHVRQRHPQGDENRAAWLGATRAQACDAARPLLPVATTSTVGIFASAQALEGLIMKLLSEPLDEAQVLGQRLLTAARAVAPVFFERADVPKYGGATTAYRGTNRQNLRELSAKLFGDTREIAQAEEVRLVKYWPGREVDLLHELLFEFTDLSLDQLREKVASLSDEERQQIYRAYIGERLNRRHRPGRAFEIPHFEWEIFSDYGCFRDLQRHRIVDAMEWQSLTPYGGYETPALILETGLESEFAGCFTRSRALYEELAAASFVTEAQYATLLGHRMRYRFVTNLREAFHLIELRTQPQGHPGYRRVCQRMYELLSEVYPEAGKAMRFVSQDEDPELIRLAAERATQYKLAKLETDA